MKMTFMAVCALTAAASFAQSGEQTRILKSPGDERVIILQPGDAANDVVKSFQTDDKDNKVIIIRRGDKKSRSKTKTSKSVNKKYVIIKNGDVESNKDIETRVKILDGDTNDIASGNHILTRKILIKPDGKVEVDDNNNVQLHKTLQKLFEEDNKNSGAAHKTIHKFRINHDGKVESADDDGGNIQIRKTLTKPDSNGFDAHKTIRKVMIKPDGSVESSDGNSPKVRTFKMKMNNNSDGSGSDVHTFMKKILIKPDGSMESSDGGDNVEIHKSIEKMLQDKNFGGNKAEIHKAIEKMMKDGNFKVSMNGQSFFGSDGNSFTNNGGKVKLFKNENSNSSISVDDRSMSFNQTPIREALLIVFKKMKKSFSISDQVKGNVTGYFNLDDVILDHILPALLKEINANYRIEGGIYEIVSKD